MSESAQYTAEEVERIREADRSGGTPQCPRCEVPLTRRPIGGGSFGLGYSRRREWLICGKCHRSALYDKRRGTRN